MNRFIKHRKLGKCEILMSYQNSNESNFMWFVKTHTVLAVNKKYSCDTPFIYDLDCFNKTVFYTLINTVDDITNSGAIPHVTKNLSPMTKGVASKRFLKSTKLGNKIIFKNNY